jgi:hypothetical protein
LAEYISPSDGFLSPYPTTESEVRGTAEQSLAVSHLVADSGKAMQDIEAAFPSLAGLGRCAPEADLGFHQRVVQGVAHGADGATWPN